LTILTVFLLLTEDTAGNVTESANRAGVVIDTQAPLAFISLSPDSLAKAGETIQIIANFSESVYNPDVYVAFAGGAIEDTVGMSGSDSTWTYNLVIPPVNDGPATISLIGDDIAGNSQTNANITGRQILRLDNISPNFISMFPDTGSFVNHTQVEYIIEETPATRLDSATITWTPISSGNAIISELVGTELNVTIHSLNFLTNDPQLVDGTLYEMSFFGTGFSRKYCYYYC